MLNTAKETIFGILPRLYGLEARLALDELEREKMAKTLKELKEAIDKLNGDLQGSTSAITTLASQVDELTKKNEQVVADLKASVAGDPDFDTVVNSVNQASSTIAENNATLSKISTEIQAKANGLEPISTIEGVPEAKIPIATVPATVNVGTGTELAPGQPDVIQPPQPA